MKKTIKYFVPFIISSILIFIAQHNDLWMMFWSFFRIPAQTIPFGDLDFILKATNVKLAGFNPYLENPMDIRYVYPSIWLGFFELFNLNKLVNFRIFNFVVIYFYVYIFFDLSFRFNNNYLKFILIILFFSSANLLALERLNIEIIVFILIYLIAISKNYFLRIPIFILAIYCKIYPIFTIFIFLRSKKIFFIMIASSLLILLQMKNEILFLMTFGNEVALNIAYGIPTLVKAIWYYSMKFEYLINDNNYKHFKYLMIVFGSVYALTLISINFKFSKKNVSKTFNLDEKLFICGAGIFIGRFIFNSNVDYSLIFLIFTIPYILKISSQKLKIILLLSIVIIFYSLLFEGGNRYTYAYFFKGVFIHSFKIFVFSIMCFYFGKVLNNHLKF